VDSFNIPDDSTGSSYCVVLHILLALGAAIS
jgi:hypothetical protein